MRTGVAGFGEGGKINEFTQQAAEVLLSYSD